MSEDIRVDYKDNGDGTHTFYVHGDSIEAIEQSQSYDASTMRYYQSVFVNGTWTVVFKEQGSTPDDYPGLSEIQQYAVRHLPSYEEAAGGSRLLSELKLEPEHPDITSAKFKKAGLDLSSLNLGDMLSNALNNYDAGDGDEED